MPAVAAGAAVLVAAELAVAVSSVLPREVEAGTVAEVAGAETVGAEVGGRLSFEVPTAGGPMGLRLCDLM